MIALEPYRFTVTDARRTLIHAHDLLDVLADGRDASVLLPLRDRLEATLAGLDPASLPATQLAEPLAAVWSVLAGAGPALRAAGQLPDRAEGVVHQLNVSDGGVPKHPVEVLQVGYDGAHGDRQGNRTHHGRPWQALCLWSLEVIDALAAQGHPIGAGSAGENVTLRGLDWAHVRPGVCLQLGSVLAEVMSYAPPCRHNARWFHDGDVSRISHERGPVSRVYARVLLPGVIRPGDAAVLEP